MRLFHLGAGLASLLVSYSSLANGRCISNGPSQIYDGADEQPHVLPRAGWGKCTAPVPPRLLSIRENGLPGIDNASQPVLPLVRRVMTLPEGEDEASMNAFMAGEIAEAEPIVWKNRAGSDQNTGIIQLLSAEAVSAGLNHLSGCTTLVIISKTGWFAAHYWESISFDPDPIWKFKNREVALQRSVLDALESGKGGSIPTHPSLKRFAGTFADDSVRAFLIKPHMSTDKAPDAYRSAWDKIKTKVGDFVPGLNPRSFANRWKEITYTKLDREDPKLDNTAAGSVLLKYDPDHPEDSKRKKISLWVEWKEEFNLEW